MNDVSEGTTTSRESLPVRKYCPRCGATDIAVSRRESLWRSILAGFNLRPYLCRACHGHFYKLESSRQPHPERRPAPAVPVSEPPNRNHTVVRAERRRSSRARRPVRSRAIWLVLFVISVIAGVAFYSTGSAPVAEVDSTPRVQGFFFEQNVNRPGSDYAAFALKQPRMELCAEHCTQDARCNAFTYVRPPVQGVAGMCYLKLEAPGPVVDKCCVTGVKSR
jgi:hypothetical protein